MRPKQALDYYNMPHMLRLFCFFVRNVFLASRSLRFQLPKDIGQTAMESLGVSSSQGTSGKSQPQGAATTVDKPKDAWDVIDDVGDKRVKEAIARAALDQFRNRGGVPQKDMWQQKQEEEEERKRLKDEAKARDRQTLAAPSAKRSRGDLFGIKAKKFGGEVGKNAKSD
jgi:hypothetical protein